MTFPSPAVHEVVIWTTIGAAKDEDFTKMIKGISIYCKISNTRHTNPKTWMILISSFKFPLPIPLKPGVKSRMKM